MLEQDYLTHLRQLQAQVWPVNCPVEPQYPLGERTLVDYLRHWANVQPSKVAIHYYGYSLDYSELNELSDRFASLLINNGVMPGDRVALFMPNCPQMHFAFYGILRAGAIVVPVSPMAKGMELSYQLNDSGAEVILCLDQLALTVEAIRDQVDLRLLLHTSLSEICPPKPSITVPALLLSPKLVINGGIDLFPALGDIKQIAPLPTVELDELGVLNYTGGTTGLPKGCAHTHRNMLYTCASFIPTAVGVNHDSISLNFMPEFWIAGENAGLLNPIFLGTTLVLLARWDVNSYLQAVSNYRVTHSCLLVDNAAEILDSTNTFEHDLSSLQVTSCVSFIKKLTPEYRHRWRQLTGCTLFESSYGMTETHTCDTFTAGMQENDFDLKSEPTFVGLPVPGTEFKICCFITGEIVALGQEGELCVRSPSLFKGYWNKPDATAEALRDGWLHTGDIGVITKQGYVRYLGRRKEMLKVNGMSVFPSELEAMLGQHPEILASAVVARPDEKSGEIPVAFVVLKPSSNQDGASLAEWCRESMAVYKVPEIRLVASLPMTATGKVQKQKLEKLI